MAMYIEIENTDLEQSQVVSRKDGTVYHAVAQAALLFRDGSKYPNHFQIRHAFTSNKAEADAAKPYQPGKYLIDETSYRISRFGELSLGDIKLKPIRVAAAAAA